MAGTNLDDDYLADLLIEDAKKSAKNHQMVGLDAFLPKRSRPAAPKPNTSFLRHIIRQTDSHNAALLAKEAEESRARLRRMNRENPGNSDGSDARRDRDHSKLASSDAIGDDSRSRKRRQEYRSDDEGREDRRRKRRSDSRDSKFRNRREKESERHRSRRYEHSDDDHDNRRSRHSDDRKARTHRYDSEEDSDVEANRRRPRHHRRNKGHRHGRGRDDSRSRRHDRRRSRSRSPRDDSRSRRKGDSSRSHRRHRSRSRSTARSRSTSPHHHKRHTTSKLKRVSPSPRHNSRSHERDSAGGKKPPDRSVPTPGSDSDPLEAIVGPLPPPSEPPIRSRGRGALKAKTMTMDAHFSSTYDPSTDVQLASDVDDEWGDNLEAFRDRQKWKQQGAERLKAVGFSAEQIKKWENGDEKSEEDVVWATKGTAREWDRGKVLDEDGDVEIRAQWGRLT